MYKTDYACNHLIGATGSFYRVTKSGNPDRRYKLGKEVNPKKVTTIKPKKLSLWDRLVKFFMIASFIFLAVNELVGVL